MNPGYIRQQPFVEQESAEQAPSATAFTPVSHVPDSQQAPASQQVPLHTHGPPLSQSHPNESQTQASHPQSTQQTHEADAEFIDTPAMAVAIVNTSAAATA
ncbi:MAG: hypothetical protein KDA85_22150 [Planctomycetaceae bacterium]|nr:hypothetical protein [Planctomycetaceae bacterium]